MGERIPAEVFSPGEYLSDELEARGWSQTELAEILGRPATVVNQIVRGKRSITPELAKELAAALGTSAELWLNLENAYQLGQAGAAPSRIARRAALRERCPIREMASRGWINNSENIDVLEAEVVRFLGVQSLADRQRLAFAAKQTAYDTHLSPSQEVWLIRVKQLAETMVVAEFSTDKLDMAVEKLRDLLRSPDEARHVPKLLADAGVRFVVVEQLPGLKVDGVCFWLSAAKPVIGMSLRHDRIDNFWFVLRHEIEHVLNGEGVDSAVIDNDLDQLPAEQSEQERRANAAASAFCVPPNELEDFVARKGPLFTDENIRQFAHRLNLHSGLVAGQLRRRLEKWNLYVKHLAKIRHAVLGTALVDGFGSSPQIGRSS